MITQFLIDQLKANDPAAWFELQIELFRQNETHENYGAALQAWVDYEAKKLHQQDAGVPHA